MPCVMLTSAMPPSNTSEGPPLERAPPTRRPPETAASPVPRLCATLCDPPGEAQSVFGASICCLTQNRKFPSPYCAYSGSNPLANADPIGLCPPSQCAIDGGSRPKPIPGPFPWKGATTAPSTHAHHATPVQPCGHGGSKSANYPSVKKQAQTWKAIKHWAPVILITALNIALTVGVIACSVATAGICAVAGGGELEAAGLAADADAIGSTIAADAAESEAAAAPARETETAASEAEKAVQSAYGTGPKFATRINGRNRILDGLNEEAVSEVENVKYQAFTRQLKDSLAFAQNKGLRFDLYIRGGSNATKLSQPLKDAISNPANNFNVRYIP
jgi:hypothetical protein